VPAVAPENLLAALHEAGHAVLAAVCGLPPAGAFVRAGRGRMTVDAGGAAMRAARHQRLYPATPSPRAAVAGQLAVAGWAMAGGAAVELRAAARPQAVWQHSAPHYGAMSRSDRRCWRFAAEKLRALGVNAGQAVPLLADWVNATLRRHAPVVARLAAALLRRGRLSGVELDRLLRPVSADAAPGAALLALAGAIMANPAMTLPPEAEEAPGVTTTNTIEGTPRHAA
jgi:hypothetical protein